MFWKPKFLVVLVAFFFLFFFFNPNLYPARVQLGTEADTRRRRH